MKKTCANCHFLGKQHSHQQSNEGRAFFVERRERLELKNGNFKGISGMYSLKCLKEVWDERFNDNQTSLQNIVCDKDRKEQCFFYSFDEGTSFKAAEELQRRLEENRQLKKSHTYTLIGLWIAAIGLALNALIELFNFFSSGV